MKELKQRHLFVPRGTKVPAEIAAVCEANVDVALIEKHWDSLVHLAASVMSGHASAVAALARFGSAAQGDPIYEAGVQLGRLLRTAFLADYFVKDAFRNELRRVLNRGEAVNALKRAIYTGRISPAQAKRVGSMLGFFFNEKAVKNFDDAKTCNLDRFSAFYNGMRQKGIYVAPSQFEALFVSIAHETEHIDLTIQAAEEVLGQLKTK